MLFDPGITDVLRNALPGLGDFFLLISQIGGELIYIALLLIWFQSSCSSLYTSSKYQWM